MTVLKGSFGRMKGSPALPAAFILAAAVLIPSCRGGPGEGVGATASSMRLTSGYTEIVMAGSRIPGYWANRVGDGERFFLFTLDRSFAKGEVILVDGAFGSAETAVFDDETRVYQGGARTNIFVVRRAAKAGPGKDGPAAPGRASP